MSGEIAVPLEVGVEDDSSSDEE